MRFEYARNQLSLPHRPFYDLAPSWPPESRAGTQDPTLFTFALLFDENPPQRLCRLGNAKRLRNRETAEALRRILIEEQRHLKSTRLNSSHQIIPHPAFRLIKN